MADKLKLALKRHFPFVYHFARGCYWKIHRLRTYLTGTKIEENRWAKRGLCEIKKSFENLDHPHRRFLIEKISSFFPFHSVLEIGCGYGPNLYLIAKKFPGIKIKGVDINSLSVQEGNKWLIRQGILNTELSIGRADKLDEFQDKSFDIVFTNAVLMFIGPDKIKKVIKEMIRIARRTLIFAEWHCGHQKKDPFGLGVYHFGNWKRNYVDLLQEVITGEQVHLTKIPPELWLDKNWKELGYVVEVLLGENYGHKL